MPRKSTSKGKSRPAYHHGDLKNALLRAGAHLLATRGADELSLRELAREAGVSHAAPYRHFADKETLLAGIAEEGFRQLTRGLEESVAKAPRKPKKQLDEAGRFYVAFAMANPELMRSMLKSLSFDLKRFPDLDHTSHQAFEALVGIIRRCQEAGLAARRNAEEQAVAAWSMIHGITLLILERQIHTIEVGGRRKPPEFYSQLVCDILWDGLRAR